MGSPQRYGFMECGILTGVIKWARLDNAHLMLGIDKSDADILKGNPSDFELLIWLQGTPHGNDDVMSIDSIVQCGPHEYDEEHLKPGDTPPMKVTSKRLELDAADPDSCAPLVDALLHSEEVRAGKYRYRMTVSEEYHAHNISKSCDTWTRPMWLTAIGGMYITSTIAPFSNNKGPGNLGPIELSKKILGISPEDDAKALQAAFDPGQEGEYFGAENQELIGVEAVREEDALLGGAGAGNGGQLARIEDGGGAIGEFNKFFEGMPHLSINQLDLVYATATVRLHFIVRRGAELPVPDYFMPENAVGERQPAVVLPAERALCHIEEQKRTWAMVEQIKQMQLSAVEFLFSGWRLRNAACRLLPPLKPAERPWFDILRTTSPDTEPLAPQVQLIQYLLIQARRAYLRKKQKDNIVLEPKYLEEYYQWTPHVTNPKCAARQCGKWACFGMRPGPAPGATVEERFEENLNARRWCMQHAVAASKRGQPLEDLRYEKTPTFDMRQLSNMVSLPSMVRLFNGAEERYAHNKHGRMPPRLKAGHRGGKPRLHIFDDDSDLGEDGEERKGADLGDDGDGDVDMDGDRRRIGSGAGAGAAAAPAVAVYSDNGGGNGRPLPKEWELHTGTVMSGCWVPKGKGGAAVTSNTESMVSVDDFCQAAFSVETKMGRMAISHYSTNFRSCVDYMKRTHDPSFPEYTPKWYLYSFLNGVFDLRRCKFFEYLDVDVHGMDMEAGCINHIPEMFNLNWLVLPPEAVQCPGYDPILNMQFNTDVETKRWMDVMLGRLFFPMKDPCSDYWEKMPVIIGLSATGKSTIATAVEKIAGHRNVGLVPNNCEEQWALSTVAGKILWMCKEMKHNFKLDNALLQSMITGETVGVHEKFKSAVDTLWTMPGLCVGNEWPASWSDPKSMEPLARRFVTFHFKKPGESQNANIACAFHSNLGPMFARCVRAYRTKLKYMREARLSDIGPLLTPAIKKGTEEFKRDTNVVVMFLSTCTELTMCDTPTLLKTAKCLRERKFITDDDILLANLRLDDVNSIVVEPGFNYDRYGVPHEEVNTLFILWAQNTLGSKRVRSLTHPGTYEGACREKHVIVCAPPDDPRSKKWFGFTKSRA